MAGRPSWSVFLSKIPLHGLNHSLIGSAPSGALAQLGERVVRNDEVRGSIPLGSTNPLVGLVGKDFTGLGLWA